MPTYQSPCVDLDEEAVFVVARRLIRCVKRNRLVEAKSLLMNVRPEDRKRIVSRKVEGEAALLVACDIGLVHFTNYLLTECLADVEQRGEFDHKGDTSTSLWFSASMNRTNIMEILLSHGADVNAMSDSQLSPLHAACAMKSREAIELLIKHGADVHQFSGMGLTCLMHAVKRADLCLLLIENGAAVNVKDKCPGQHGGNTVLHCAIQEGKRDPVELLLTQGADVDIQNNSGDNAFHAAVFRGCSDVLDVLTKLSQPSIQRQIETHELLGCHFADERDDKEKALVEWRTAMQMREENDMLLSPDDIKPPLSAYMNRVEAITPQELDTISTYSDHVYTQSLIVTERVLGSEHERTLGGLMQRGRVYAHYRRYQRCAELWKYALTLRRKKKERVAHEELDILQELNQLYVHMEEMHSAGAYAHDAVRYEDVSSLFNLVCDEVDAAFLSNKDGIFDITSKEDFHTLVLILLHLLRLLDNITTRSDDIQTVIHRIHKLQKMKGTLLDGRTFLHLAVDYKSSIVGKVFCHKFPNRQVVELLLKCGADVNALDIGGNNTPLHICSKLIEMVQRHKANRRWRWSRMDLQQIAAIVQVLITHGAHIDARNKRGQPASDFLGQLPMKQPTNLMSLKCLAARSVKDNKIPYAGEVPRTLLDFLDLH